MLVNDFFITVWVWYIPIQSVHHFGLSVPNWSEPLNTDLIWPRQTKTDQDWTRLTMNFNDLMSKVSNYYWSNKKNSYDPSLRMVWPQMFYPQHGALMVASTAAHKSAGFGLKIRWQSQSEKLDWRFPHFCLGIHWLIFTNSNSVHLRPRRSSECNADCPSAPTLDEVTTSPPWSQIYAPLFDWSHKKKTLLCFN